MYSDRFRQTEKRMISDVYRDNVGLLRWQANHLPVPSEVCKVIAMYECENGFVMEDSPRLQRMRKEALK